MKIRELVSDILFPVRCPLCGSLIPLGKNGCTCQTDEVTLISDDFCRHCASERDRCSCKKGSTFLENVASVYLYSGRIKSQIALFKFAKEKKYAREFSLRMGERVAKVYCDVNFDAVTFVPSSKKSIKERGFNQSELLAKGISEKLFVPLVDFLLKVRETELQHDLSAIERVKNLDGAFALKDGLSVSGKTVLLCDDVKTTGTTLRKCADVLYENGAKNVCCIVLAVTDYLKDF